MRKIRLKGKNGDGKFAAVDDEDYDYLIQWEWFVVIAKSTCYASRIEDGKRISMHRAIMNPTSKKLVDHKDRNGLNNQKSNLRVCTHSQNQYNKTSVFNSSSKYLGVSVLNQRNPHDKKVYKYWRAQINNRLGHTHIISKFPYNEWGEIEAAIAYNEAAKYYYGEFANLNIIK